MKHSKLLIIVLVAFVAALGILKVGFGTKAQLKELTNSSVKVDIKPAQQAELIIKAEDPIRKELDISSEETVFSLLQKSGVEFEYENYESGAFITSIEEVSTPTKSWFYYVNGKL